LEKKNRTDLNVGFNGKNARKGGFFGRYWVIRGVKTQKTTTAEQFGDIFDTFCPFVNIWASR
jgi:hypothetical protein